MGSTAADMDCDILIVGAGAAGCVLAHSLIGSGARIVLLEAGGFRGAGRVVRSLYEGTSADPAFLLPPDRDRCRGVGGSSAMWGGRCMPYDPVDFAVRDHVPHSGLPIPLQELEPFYREAQAYADCGDYSYDSAEAGLDGRLIEGFESSALLTETLERWSPPTHFGKSLGEALRAAPNVRIVTGAVATRILRNGPAVGGVEAVRIRGRAPFTITASRTVLAGGGLESVRLMLASDRIGDHSGWLGRGYMTHVGGVISRLRFTPGTAVVFGYEKDAHGVYVRRRFTFSAEAQAAHGLLNMYALLDRPLLADADHGSAVLSLAWLAKRLVQRQSKGSGGDAGGGVLGLYRRHLRNLVFGAPEVLSVLPRFGRDRFLKGRRMPSLLMASGDNSFYLYFHSEQRPDRRNRIELDPGSVDALGMPRLRIEAALLDDDADAILRAHALIGHELRAAGRGDLEFLDPDDPMATLRSDCTATLGHHIGGARMAVAARDGVIDSDLRVHGLDNLYVASAASLPVSSQAHPTLTVLALALRLGRRLGRP